jgi:propanol-preferring alcohol dehydrogenase
MKAVRLIEPEHPLQLQDITIPTIGENDILVRVKAAGICHTDVHYRAGRSPVHPLPRTLGHEIAGTVEQKGNNVTSTNIGDRVCVHYVLSCGSCYYCNAGNDQFCIHGSMIGRYIDGGYAEYVLVPQRNLVPLPDEIPFEQGAIMMCSSATAFHALRKSRLQGGETVAIFGIGGLGISAIQLAYALGALEVYAVDINLEKLNMAEKFGAIPINATSNDSVSEIRSLTKGKGVNVAIEMIGIPQVMKQVVQSLAVMGRAVIVGITDKPIEIDTYHELLGREAEIIGSNDHLLHELPLLLEFARHGKLKLSDAITHTIPLDANTINHAMDNLENFSSDVRTVITP